jgi:flagellar biosynthesis protein FlhF
LEAREQAAQALGKGAVILTTREVKRAGLGGMFGGTDVEVAAAVLGPATELQARLSPRPFSPSAYSTAAESVRPRATMEEREILASLRAEVHGEMRAMKLALARNTAPAAELASELIAIREMLAQMTPSNRGDKLAKLVAARGIEGAAATTVLRAMRATPEGAVIDRLRASLTALLEVSPWPLLGKGRTLIAAVGPTGVGKTTTLAKLATHAKIDKKTVTLVTCDTFRVGGVEQIKRYASLLDVRHEVARDVKGLAAILASSESDVILVDTSGRPFRADSVEGLLTPERFASLEGSGGISRHLLLCLPASMRWVDAVRTVKSFAAAKPVAIAVTKIDETDTPSGIVHAALASKLPLSLLCTGPRVPEDIEAATAAGVVERVLGEGSKDGKAR